MPQSCNQVRRPAAPKVPHSSGRGALQHQAALHTDTWLGCSMLCNVSSVSYAQRRTALGSDLQHCLAGQAREGREALGRRRGQ